MVKVKFIVLLTWMGKWYLNIYVILKDRKNSSKALLLVNIPPHKFSSKPQGVDCVLYQMILL